MASVFRNNFNREFGVRNATSPRRGPDLVTLNNLQAGGVWSGIEFAFASLLIDHGHYTDGVQIVEAIHRRYLRAGQPALPPRRPAVEPCGMRRPLLSRYE